MKKAFTYISYLLYLALGVLLLRAAFTQVSINELYKILQEGNYIMVLPVFIVSISGYYFRIARWLLTLININEKADKSTLFASLCMGYGVNYVVPRLGELTRCLLLRKSHQIPVDKSLITVVFERIVDTLCLFLLLFILLTTYATAIRNFIDEHILSYLRTAINNLPVYLTLLLVVLLISLLYLAYIKMTQSFLHYRSIVIRLFRTTLQLNFWLYTIGIWVCYFLMTYLWFYTFHETSTLTVADAFFIMIVGSIGRSVPIQGGGLGAYHFLVANACVLLGVSLVAGNALAVVIHGIQSIFTISLTLIAYLWYLKKYK